MGEETPEPAEASRSRAPVSRDERLERLSRIVSTRTLEGYSVVDRNDQAVSAVLNRPGKPVNHVLHGIISIFTCGLWAIVWIILALTQRREQRVRLSIDQYGNLLEETMTPQ